MGKQFRSARLSKDQPLGGYRAKGASAQAAELAIGQGAEGYVVGVDDPARPVGL